MGEKEFPQGLSRGLPETIRGGLEEISYQTVLRVLGSPFNRNRSIGAEAIWLYKKVIAFESISPDRRTDLIERYAEREATVA